MNASQYLVPGAVLVAAVIVAALVLVIVRKSRRREVSARESVAPRPSVEWLPPGIPAPLDQLASLSLDTRIAAWVDAASDERSEHAGAESGVAPPATTPLVPRCPEPEPVAARDQPAPVELWFGGARVLVHEGTATSDEFRRYANELLAELARARGR